MKKAFMMFLVLMLLSLPAGVGAVEPDAGAAALAQYFSEDTQLFYGMRTDEAYLDELDGLLADVIAKLPASIAAEIPPTTLRGELVKGLADASENTGLDLSLESLREWLGDYLAFATNDLNQSNPPSSLAVSITDRAAAERFWDTVIVEAPAMTGYTRIDGGDFTLYENDTDLNQPLVAIHDDVMLLTTPSLITNGEILPAAPLSESEAFQTALSHLPAEAYNIIGYVSADAFDMEASGLVTSASVLNPGNVAFGLTILDEVTLTIDVVQNNPENTTPALPPLDPTFARFIPANAAAVAHSTDLSALYTLLVQQLKATGSSTDAPEQIKSGLAMLGIDLQEDILGWTTGDYAVYMAIDPEAYVTITGLGGFGAPPAFDTFPLNAGLLIEATDPEAAATLANKLTNTLKQFASNQPEITFSDVTVAGTAATVISIEVPMGTGDSLTLELILGASDEVFFFGTAPDLMATLAGEPGLDQSALYQATSAYFVPQPSSILYTDDSGLLTVTVVPVLAFIGPAVGNVFDNIVEELEAEGSSSSYPQAQFVAYQSDPTPAEFLQAWSDIIGSSSITSTYAIVGITLTRAVITLEE